MKKQAKRAPIGALVSEAKVAKALRAHKRGVEGDALYWRFLKMDLDANGSFGWHLVTALAMRQIHSRLAELEKKTWSEILTDTGGGGKIASPLNKFIECGDLIAEAQNRLKVIDMDDQDRLFRLRIGNMGRLWGVIDDGPPRCFLVLWWDPGHVICPSAKR